MLNRLLFTIATAACLTGLYAVYAVIARPLVVVPDLQATSNETSNHAVAHRPVDNVRVAETYLSELRWAAKSKYTLKAEQAFIYTNDWDHKGNSPWIEFAPFAMVWLQKDSQGNEQAISLVSDSAQLKFASPFDTINPNPGRVVSAVLNGTVQVKGPDGLAIAGRQFIFDESAPSLVSTYPVQFEYGSHSGSGRSLNMKLIPAEGAPGKDRPHVYGIRSVRLNGGIDPNSAGASPNSKKYMPAKLDLRVPQSEETKLVHIQCRRDLMLDIPSQTILFSEDVRAHSPVSARDYDQLECDELLLEFAPKRTGTGGSLAESSPSQSSFGEKGADFQRLSSDLVFQRLTASGRSVKLASTQNQLRASMRRLVYDAPEHRLQLGGAGDDVRIIQKQSTLKVPEVEVLLREDNTLREILCRGNGALDVTNSDTNELAFVATWAGFLRKSTDSQNGLDLIELQQLAYFSQPGQKTALGAELIRLWLDPIQLNVLSTPKAGSTTTPVEPKPKRLVAERGVGLVSPQLVVTKCGELDVRFEDDGVPRELGMQSRGGLQQVSLEQRPDSAESPAHQRQAAMNSADGAKSRRSGLRAAASQTSPSRTSDVGRGSLGPPIEIPSSAGPANRTRVASVTDNNSPPLDVIADRIRVQMQNVEGQSQPELVEVETTGHVTISQRRPLGEAPMTAKGDRLLLQNRGRSREIVHLFGSPAHLRDRGLHVEGREVHLDRGANRVWVKGNGLIQLPMKQGTSFANLGQTTSDPDLDVWWEESMEFDGRTARFIGKVLAELGQSKMRCEQMDVNLASAISFSEPAQHDSQPTLKSIQCREDVSFQSSQLEGSRMVQVLRGRVAEFTHDHELGTSSAQGPGQMQYWKRTEKSPGGSQRQQIQANRPIGAVTAEWDYTRINFKGRMTGNIVMSANTDIESQISKFHNSVSIVHGPVNRPNETIDADHLPAEAGNMRCEELEFSHHAKGPNNKKDYQQMVGKRNAQIEGRGFYANADEISYDGSKGLYILRAWGNQNATIAQDSPKGPRSEYAGRRIDFNPTLKEVYVDRVSGATGP